MPKKPIYSIEKFNAAIQSVTCISTDQAVLHLDRMNFWVQDEIDYQVLQYKRAVVRRFFQQLRGDDGRRQMLSLFVADEATGQKVRVYKRRGHMTLPEYRQAIAFYVQWGMKGINVAKELARECKEVHGIKPRLPGLF